MIKPTVKYIDFYYLIHPLNVACGKKKILQSPIPRKTINCMSRLEAMTHI